MSKTIDNPRRQAELASAPHNPRTITPEALTKELPEHLHRDGHKPVQEA